MVAQLAEIQWRHASRRHARTSRNEAASATGVHRLAGSRERPATGVLVGETLVTVAREAAIPVRIVAEAEEEAEIVSAIAAFPVAEDPAAPADSAAPEDTAAAAREAAVRAAHPAWAAPAEAAEGGGES